ncbi:MAG TPA: aminoacyl-tRNA hydrolase, partial [Tepidisphaeraceae bacterium]|nr:aminoacyl-tRNA hydrolase [Tepidisphaeraceae bacterium]
MKLIVGLGNPGPEYSSTRHNVGFDVLDLLAHRLNWIPKPDDFNRLARNKFQALLLDGPTPTDRALLLKPMTYMNLSGQPVQAALAFYHLTPADLIVVSDDIALPCGKIRIRANGSPGGHNGLKDIERALSTQDYPRLRIGIDPPPPRHPQADYVLGKFTPTQRTALTPALHRATDALLLWLEKGTTPTMNRYNSDPPV